MAQETADHPGGEGRGGGVNGLGVSGLAGDIMNNSGDCSFFVIFILI